jgi:hypothetical protein
MEKITYQEAKEKKPYSSPAFLEYGNLAKLTQGGSPSTLSDSGSNNMRPATPCL